MRELLEAFKTETSGPSGAAEVAAMSAATSPGTGLAYGLQRASTAWGFARSVTCYRHEIPAAGHR